MARPTPGAPDGAAARPMDLLIAETLEPEVLTWLETRHAVRYAPQLALDPRAFRQGLYDVRGLILPAQLAVDPLLLQHAPMLRAVGRISAGVENIDLEACTKAGVEVVRCLTASAPAEAEFMLQALLSLLRRFPGVCPAGKRAGRGCWDCGCCWASPWSRVPSSYCSIQPPCPSARPHGRFAGGVRSQAC